MVTLANVVAWLNRLADVYAENKDDLTQLDSAIGDADHGINMARGFEAVKKALAEKPQESLAGACKTVSMILIKTVGGASGPLYGTLFMRLGPGLGNGDSASLETLVKALGDGVEGIKKMGRSQGGEKTMLEAWLPALASLDGSVKSGASDKDALAAAAAAAEQGMKDTIPMLATKGRASYLGERSVGHQDPGATSTWLMLKTLAECVG
jgi:dihydroxyacetone kinase-like protein